MGELATKVRAKYPGVYDAIPDAELESKIVAKFPGVYDHLVAKQGTRVSGNPDASPAETERLRREFVRQTGTIGERAQDIGRRLLKDPLDTLTEPTAPANSLGDMALRVAPESVVKLAPRTLSAMYQQGKNMVMPYVDAVDNIRQGYPVADSLAKGVVDSGAATARGLYDVADFVTSRVGLQGYDKAKEGLLTDPAGTALALKGGFEVAKPGIRKLSELKPIEGTARVLEGAANKLTDMTLKQSTVLKPVIRDQNVRVAHEGNFQPTSKGVDSLNSTIAVTEKALADGIAAGDVAQIKGTLQKSIANVETLREKANRSSDPTGNNALIDAEIERLNNHPLLDENGGINIGTMQQMKVEQGREIQKSYGGEKPAQFQNSIDKARVRGMKEELESALDSSFPELSATNKKLGEYYALKKSLERAANRIENNQGIGIGAPIKAGAGATVGGMLGGPAGAAVGGGIGTLIGIIEHPAVAPKLGQMLYKASKGAMSKSEALKVAKQRIADLSFKDMASTQSAAFMQANPRLADQMGKIKDKVKDERGLVGKDIGKPMTREEAIKDREQMYKDYEKQLDISRPRLNTSNGEPNIPTQRMVIPALTLDQIPTSLEYSGFTKAEQTSITNHLKQVVAYGEKVSGKKEVNPIFGKQDIQEAIDAVIKRKSVTQPRRLQ